MDGRPALHDMLHMPALALVLASLGVGLARLALMGRPGGLAHALFKAMPMLLMAGAVRLAGGPGLLSAALVLSALGDFALALRGRAAFLYGLAAFALAHLLYLLLMLGLAARPIWDVFSDAPVAALAVLALIFSSELWLAPHAGAMRWPVRIYVLLIGAMMLAAWLLWSRSALPALGASAFAASDTILALELFRLPPESGLRRISAPALWVLYLLGQALLALGLMALA